MTPPPYPSGVLHKHYTKKRALKDTKTIYLCTLSNSSTTQPLLLRCRYAHALFFCFFLAPLSKAAKRRGACSSHIAYKPYYYDSINE